MPQFERPTGSFAGTSGANRTKYQDDSAAVPKRAISSSKVDGDLNYILDALNTIWGLNASGSYTDIEAAIAQIRQNQLDIGSLAVGSFIAPSASNVVAYSTDGTTWSSGKVTDAMFRNSSALSVVGRSSNSIGSVSDIVASSDGHILRRSGSTVAFGTVPATSITYSNGTSGLSATNVQAAIDEIDSRIDGLGDFSDSLFRISDNLDTSKKAAFEVSSISASTVRTISLPDKSGTLAMTIDLVDSSETVKGLIEIATSSETLTGTDSVRAITPASFAANKSLSGNGYYKMPGGLILQWGSGTLSGTTNNSTTSVSFPTSFSTSCFFAVAGMADDGATAGCQTLDASFNTTGMTLRVGNTGNAGNNSGFYWFAIGV